MKPAVRVEKLLIFLFCLFALSLAGCATFEDNFPGSSLSQDNFPPWDSPPGTSGQAPYRSRDEITQPPSADEKAVLVSAQALIGMAPESVVKVNGRTFVLDCIGTVSAIFYGMSIDVQRDFPRYKGDGVGRLYQSLAALHALHRDLYPRAGDIIFWDNTWDARGDGKLDDDPLTHAGVVLSVDSDGTIRYVHEHVVKGVTVEAMNLLHPRDYYDPQGRIINNAMAMNSGISRSDNPPHWTSGDLWNSFGDILRVQDHFAVAGAPPGQERPAEDRLAVRPPVQP